MRGRQRSATRPRKLGWRRPRAGGQAGQGARRRGRQAEGLGDRDRRHADVDDARYAEACARAQDADRSRRPACPRVRSSGSRRRHQARQGASRHASSTRTPRCAQETSRLSAVSPSQARGAADAQCRIKGDAVSSSVRGSGPRPSPSGSRWTSNSLLPLQPPRHPRRRLSPVSHGPTRSWRMGDARAAHAPPGREPAHGCVLTALRAGTVRRGSVPTPE